jgi:hypothetical protein
MDQRAVTDEEPKLMQIWNLDVDRYRTGQLRMISNREYVYHVASNIVRTCFDKQSKGKGSYVEAVLWKRSPELLTYWLDQTLQGCLTKLFKVDINIPGQQSIPVESDPVFLKRLWPEAHTVGVEVKNSFSDTFAQTWEGKRARLASIGFFCSNASAFATILQELAAMTDEDYSIVFDSTYKHLDILLQCGLTIVLYTRAHPTFLTDRALVSPSLEAFVEETLKAAAKVPVKPGHEPKFELCSFSQNRVLFYTANVMRIANTFITGSRKGRLMEISSRLVEGSIYATGGGRSEGPSRREVLFSFITDVIPKPRPSQQRTMTVSQNTAPALGIVNPRDDVAVGLPQSVTPMTPCTNAVPFTLQAPRDDSHPSGASQAWIGVSPITDCESTNSSTPGSYTPHSLIPYSLNASQGGFVGYVASSSLSPLQSYFPPRPSEVAAAENHFRVHPGDVRDVGTSSRGGFEIKRARSMPFLDALYSEDADDGRDFKRFRTGSSHADTAVTESSACQLVENDASDVHCLNGEAALATDGFTTLKRVPTEDMDAIDDYNKLFDDVENYLQS